MINFDRFVISTEFVDCNKNDALRVVQLIVPNAFNPVKIFSYFVIQAFLVFSCDSFPVYVTLFWVTDVVN